MKPEKQFENAVNATADEQIREFAVLEYLQLLDSRRTYNLPVNNSFVLPTGNKLIFIDNNCCRVSLSDKDCNELAVIELPGTANGEFKAVVELQAGLRYLRANGCEVIKARYGKSE
jgi:hypothetical protein